MFSQVRFLRQPVNAMTSHGTHHMYIVWVHAAVHCDQTDGDAFRRTTHFSIQ